MDSNKYDLVLVIEYYRSVAYYLSVIKYLAPDVRIGLYVVPMDEKLLAKNREAQSDFIDACVSFGAKLIEGNNIEANVLLIPQRVYRDDARKLIAGINARRKVGALTLAWAGIPQHDQFFEQLGIEVAFVIDRRFLDHLLSKRGDKTVFQNRKLIEVGLPFMRYPVFEHVTVDYVVAIPTPFSFAHENDKWMFMETVLSLFEKMQPNDIIALKTHNGMDRDQFSSGRYRWLGSLLGRIPKFDSSLRKIAKATQGHTTGFFWGRLYTSYLYEKVLKRAVPFSRMTEFSQFALEAFLPGVRKGVIGGLSNTTWGALYASIPYYNCVDVTVQQRDAKDRLYGKKDATITLETNLDYYAVPYCRGDLRFDTSHFNILAESTRNADLIAEIRKQINLAKAEAVEPAATTCL